MESFSYYKGERGFLVSAYKPGSATLKIKVKKSSGTKTYKVKVKKIEYGLWDEAKDDYITKNIKNNSKVLVKKYNTYINVTLYDTKSKITYIFYLDL